VRATEDGGGVFAPREPLADSALLDWPSLLNQRRAWPILGRPQRRCDWAEPLPAAQAKLLPFIRLESKAVQGRRA